MANITINPPNTPFGKLDERGVFRIANEWYRFFAQLDRSSNTATTDISDTSALVPFQSPLVPYGQPSDELSLLLGVSYEMTCDPQGAISLLNSSTTPLAGAATFTGTGEQNFYPDVGVSCITDADGTLYFDFSNDGTNWDSSQSFSVAASTHEFHTSVKLGRYFRVRFINGSSAQSYLRLYTYFGRFRQGNLPLNSIISQDSDAIVTRSLGEEITMAEGKFSGYSIINKFGRNHDLDSGTEDLWNGGGTYTGFPTGSPETLMAVSTSASDTGVLTFTYLATSTSTAYQTGTVTLNGTTPVNTGISAYRMHTAEYASGSSTTFNLGEISLYHQTTTSNIFCKMPIGRSQTNTAAYTVPAGSTAYIKRLFGMVKGSGTSSVDFDLWVRTLGGSPRLRRPNQAVQGDGFNNSPYGGIIIPAGADVKMQLTTTGNNLDVIGGFDIVLVKN